MQRLFSQQRHRAAHGFSLIELLVAVTIGLFVVLASFTVLSASEGRKRTATSTNDANQAGAYAAYVIDRALRSAGSGYVQRWGDIGGCRLNVKRAGTVLWPAPAALPAPFASIPQTLRLAPVLVAAGPATGGSDTIIVMAGTAGFGESPALVNTASTAASGAVLQNTVGLRERDLVLLAGGGECLLEQLAVPGPQSLNFDQTGTYYTASGTTTSLTALAGVGPVYAFSIGNAVALGGSVTGSGGSTITGNPPQFQMFGVDSGHVLVSLDMLRTDGGSAPLPVGEGVLELRALYGVDTNDDGQIDSWVAPTTAPWTLASLMDGSVASNANLRRIVAVRVGMVLRTSLIEKDIVAPDSIDMFADMGALKRTVSIKDTSNVHLRHRVVETTVPVRNLLLRSS